MKVFNSFQEVYNATSQRHIDRADTPCCVWERTDPKKKNDPVQNDWKSDLRDYRKAARDSASDAREVFRDLRDVTDIASGIASGIGAVGSTVGSWFRKDKSEGKKRIQNDKVDNFVAGLVPAAVAVGRAVAPQIARQAPKLLGGLRSAAGVTRDVAEIAAVGREGYNAIQSGMTTSSKSQ